MCCPLKTMRYVERFSTMKKILLMYCSEDEVCFFAIFDPLSLCPCERELSLGADGGKRSRVSRVCLANMTSAKQNLRVVPAPSCMELYPNHCRCSKCCSSILESDHCVQKCKFHPRNPPILKAYGMIESLL